MRVEVNVTDAFKKAARPLIRKYRTFLDDLDELESQLIADPETGVSLGSGVFKVRLRIKSKRKGKSGGARVITLLERFESSDGKSVTVNLLTVYDKSDQADISDRELRSLIDNF